MQKPIVSNITSPWDPVEARQSKHTIKREAVLHTAVLFFNERGFHSTSLEDVALSLNVTKPTIYHYFSSKDEILFECVRLGLKGIREAVEAVSNRNGSARERLVALMHDYGTIMTKDFGMCVTRTADHELSAKSRTEFRALKREIDMLVRSLVEEGINDGSVAKGDARLITFTITGALNWIAHWYDPAGPLSAQDVVDGCVATLLGGLIPNKFTAEPEKKNSK